MRQPDPIAFSIGGLDIRWYGVLIAAGMCLCVLILTRRSSRFGIKEDDILDTCLWMLPIGVIGARAYYVLFNLNYYHSLRQALNIRAGGLAIHGGIIFAALTVIFVCRHKKISTLNMLDLIMSVLPLGQAIGRWGNFFNGEAHGGPTNLPWGIWVDGVKVHPTFLYESIWCLLLFIFLSWWIKDRRTFRGQIVCMYAALYSVERYLVEGLRTDSLMIGPFKQAQVLSLVVIIGSVIMYNYWRKKCPIKEF
ncbi:MAG: prolipoprotein diacylglyceryl transferase [Mogibacterium sp.]|nr:prolipoprotein diacylglyceryl transferase [Mogibacterium sp.]